MDLLSGTKIDTLSKLVSVTNLCTIDFKVMQSDISYFIKSLLMKSKDSSYIAKHYFLIWFRDFNAL